MLIKAGFTVLQLEGKLDKKVEYIIMSLAIIIITILHSGIEDFSSLLPSPSLPPFLKWSSQDLYVCTYAHTYHYNIVCMCVPVYAYACVYMYVLCVHVHVHMCMQCVRA